MKIDFSSLQNSSLFNGVSTKDMLKLCDCLCAKEKMFESGEFVFHAGDRVRFVYFIVSGSVHIINEDFWGNQSLIETMNRNVLFGEAYVFSKRENHIVSVVAAENCVILEISPDKLFEACANGCEGHTKLIRNTLGIVSEKVVRLTEKQRYIMRRTTREKLLSYLSVCARKEKKNTFSIPYSRQQLADYLCVDRSALSHELSKLQKQGMLQYRKNRFELLTDSHEELY